jgi:uncharacterized protein YktB (UPF0637 family)
MNNLKEKELTDAEIAILKERIAQVEKGEFITYEEWEKERLARRASRSNNTSLAERVTIPCFPKRTDNGRNPSTHQGV